MFRLYGGHHQANKEYFFKVQQLSTQWDPILFTVKVKIAYDKTLIGTKTLKENGN